MWRGRWVWASQSRQPSRAVVSPHPTVDSPGERWDPTLLIEEFHPRLQDCTMFSLLPTGRSGPLPLRLASLFPLFHLHHLRSPSAFPLTHREPSPKPGRPFHSFSVPAHCPPDNHGWNFGAAVGRRGFSSSSTTHDKWPWALSHSSTGGLSTPPHPLTGLH